MFQNGPKRVVIVNKSKVQTLQTLPYMGTYHNRIFSSFSKDFYHPKLELEHNCNMKYLLKVSQAEKNGKHGKMLDLNGLKRIFLDFFGFKSSKRTAC